MNFAINLRIAAVLKSQNGSGWQVVADLHFKNSAINKKLFGKTTIMFKSILKTDL